MRALPAPKSISPHQAADRGQLRHRRGDPVFMAQRNQPRNDRCRRVNKQKRCPNLHHNSVRIIAHSRFFVPSRWLSSCFRRWWHSRLWAAWIVRRNAPNGRVLSSRAPRFAAGLFMQVGGDAVAFGVEESANSHLPPGIHVTAHDKLRLFCGIFALPPEFHLAIAALPVHLQARHRSLAGGNLHHRRNDLLEPYCRRLSYLSLLRPLHRLQSI